MTKERSEDLSGQTIDEVPCTLQYCNQWKSHELTGNEQLLKEAFQT